MKPLFYLLTAAAHPFGLYVVVPLYMEHCYVVTGSDGAGRAMAAGFAARTPSEDLCRRCGYAARFRKQ